MQSKIVFLDLDREFRQWGKKEHVLRDRTQFGNTGSIVAIVCAYDEASQVCGVLRMLTSYGLFRKVIVVDDGSRDATAEEVIRLFPTVLLIRHGSNLGKGGAMETAVQATAPEDEFFFFCDADVLGLTHQMIDDILRPVVRGCRDMMIAQRTSPLYAVPFILAITPKLGGVRAVTRGLWKIIPEVYKRRFKIEAALNYFARKHGKGFGYKVINGLAQVIKEKKYGLRRGFIARMKMCTDVFLTYIQLRSLGVTFRVGSIPSRVRE